MFKLDFIYSLLSQDIACIYNLTKALIGSICFINKGTEGTEGTEGLIYIYYKTNKIEYSIL